MIKIFKYLFLLTIWSHKKNTLLHEMNDYRRKGLYHPYVERLSHLIGVYERGIFKIKGKHKPSMKISYRKVA